MLRKGKISISDRTPVTLYENGHVVWQGHGRTLVEAQPPVEQSAMEDAIVSAAIRHTEVSIGDGYTVTAI